MTNPLLAALVGATVALVVSAVNDRFQRRRDRDQAAERRAERREQSEERRAERLNAERLALYVDIIGWAETTAERVEAWTSTDNRPLSIERPSTELRARVDLLASPFVLEQFQEVLSSRWFVNEVIEHLNRTDPDGVTTTLDDLWETKQDHADALRRLRDACRSDMQGVLPDWHPDAEDPDEDLPG